MVLFNQPQTYYRAFQLALLSILYFSSAMASAEPEMHSQQTTQRAHQLLFSENTRHSLENMLPTGTLMIVHFAFDSSDLTDASKEGLDELAAELRSQNWLGRQISIQGHTDNLGSVKYNQELGERRAQTVKKYLSFRTGVQLERFRLTSYGNNEPLMTNVSRQGRYFNRRVEIKITL